MLFWIILAALVVFIVLILLTPVGADIRYEDDVIRLSLKVGGMRMQLIPRRKKKRAEEKAKREKKTKKEKKSREKEPKEEKELDLPFNDEELLELIKLVIDSLGGYGGFLRKVSIDRFMLHWICPGSWDPYLMTNIFGMVNASLSVFVSWLCESFPFRDVSVWTDIDYVRNDMKLEFCLVMTVRIHQILASGLKTGFAAFRIWQRSKKRRKREAQEEKEAMEKWLKEHPEDRALLEQQKRQEEIPKSA